MIQYIIITQIEESNWKFIYVIYTRILILTPHVNRVVIVSNIINKIIILIWSLEFKYI